MRIHPDYKAHRAAQAAAQSERLADKLLRIYCSPGVKHEYASEKLHPEQPLCYCYTRYCVRCGHTMETLYPCHSHV